MLTEILVTFIVTVISRGGYGAVFFLMMLESMVAPVPSEAVMPFAGFLVARDRFTMTGVIASSSLGSIAGSLLSYYMGLYGGRPFVLRLGRYLFLNERHLELTHAFFERYGEPAILAGRFVPVIRHLISIPAGMGKMNIATFSFYTLLGATCWNFILAYAGMALGERWDVIHTYSQYIDVCIIALLVMGVSFFFWSHLKNRN